MAIVLVVIGAIWAVIGILNVVASDASNDSLLAFVVLFNMILFVFPGLGLCAAGMALGRRRPGGAA